MPRAAAGRGARVIVVGAGMAGLVAATELLRAGHDPVVLEAQQRVGGRVLTLREPFAPGLWAEAGAMRIPQPKEVLSAGCGITPASSPGWANRLSPLSATSFRRDSDFSLSVGRRARHLDFRPARKSHERIPVLRISSDRPAADGS
jgi:monoamine oxidase